MLALKILSLAIDEINTCNNAHINAQSTEATLRRSLKI
jgi:hypothetical protein